MDLYKATLSSWNMVLDRDVTVIELNQRVDLMIQPDQILPWHKNNQVHHNGKHTCDVEVLDKDVLLKIIYIPIFGETHLNISSITPKSNDCWVFWTVSTLQTSLNVFPFIVLEHLMEWIHQYFDVHQEYRLWTFSEQTSNEGCNMWMAVFKVEALKNWLHLFFL